MPIAYIVNCHIIEFLPEREYVTFGSLLSQLSVCRLSVTFVNPILRGLKLSAIFHRCVPWPSLDLGEKIYRDSPRRTPSSGALRKRDSKIERIERWWTSKAIHHTCIS